MWLIKILLMALFLVFLVQNNNDLVSVWPIPESSLMVGVSVVYLAMFCLGYLYAPKAEKSKQNAFQGT